MVEVNEARRGDSARGDLAWKLSSLISRVEKATGPDRTIDVDVMNLLCPRSKNEARLFLGKQLETKWGGVGEIANKTTYFVEAPRLTTSVDAAISLAERVLPGWGWGITHGSEKAEDVQGNVFPKAIPFPAHLDCYGYHAIPAIALVLATLRAFQSKGQEA